MSLALYLARVRSSEVLGGGPQYQEVADAVIAGGLDPRNRTQTVGACLPRLVVKKCFIGRRSLNITEEVSHPVPALGQALTFDRALNSWKKFGRHCRSYSHRSSSTEVADIGRKGFPRHRPVRRRNLLGIVYVPESR